jgi:transposase
LLAVQLAVQNVVLAMKAYSQDLRARIIQAIDRQVGTQSEVAEIFGVSRTFVKKVLRLRREKGCFAPQPHRGGRAPVLAGEALELLRRRLAEQPDTTLEEFRQHLAEQTNVHVSIATISRARRKLKHRRERPSRRHESVEKPGP